MNQTVKIGIAVVALVAAVVITFVFGRGDDEQQRLAEATATFWMCAGCGDTFNLTARQVDVCKEAGSAMPPFSCPKCKERKLYGALKCDQCGTPYFGREVPDSSGVCPKCNPDAKPLPPVIEEDVPVQEEGATDEQGEPIKTRRVPRPKAA